MTANRAAVEVGSLARSIEFYIHQADFEAARKHLEDWDWQFPTHKLAGYSTLLWVRFYQAQKQHRRAIQESADLVGAAERSNYAPATPAGCRGKLAGVEGQAQSQAVARTPCGSLPRLAAGGGCEEEVGGDKVRGLPPFLCPDHELDTDYRLWEELLYTLVQLSPYSLPVE